MNEYLLTIIDHRNLSYTRSWRPAYHKIYLGKVISVIKMDEHLANFETQCLTLISTIFLKIGGKFQLLECKQYSFKKYLLNTYYVCWALFWALGFRRHAYKSSNHPKRNVSFLTLECSTRPAFWLLHSKIAILLSPYIINLSRALKACQISILRVRVTQGMKELVQSDRVVRMKARSNTRHQSLYFDSPSLPFPHSVLCPHWGTTKST